MSASAAVTPTAPLRLRAAVEQETPHETLPPHRRRAGLAAGGRDRRGMAAALRVRRPTPQYDARLRCAMNDRVSGSALPRRPASRRGPRRASGITLHNITAEDRTDGGETETRMLTASPEIRDVLSGTVRHRAAAGRQARPGARDVVARGCRRQRLMAPFIVNPDNVHEFKTARRVLQVARKATTTRPTRSGSRSTRRAPACPRSRTSKRSTSCSAGAGSTPSARASTTRASCSATRRAARRASGARSTAPMSRG